ncbi:MAG: hypothetical protein ACOC0C_09240, partial [Bacteroidota bacterium]
NTLFICNFLIPSHLNLINNQINTQMPYRRLPNTDVARIKALKLAYLRGKEFPPFKLAFSQVSLQRIISFLPSFEKAIMEYRQSYQTQVNKNNDYQKELKKARLYLSHFIQVMNMAIVRGDMPSNIREYYGLNDYKKKLPPLNSETDLIEWGDRIIKGEQLRTMKGQTPVTNPTVAVVKVRYEKFMEGHHHQKTLQKNVQRALEHLADLREKADSIIAAVWDEVEDHYGMLSDQERRKNAENYGVVYVFRKNEVRELSLSINSPSEVH